ncbi:MAG: hypothetical protein ACXVX0_01325 [Blastococcus sp.]
MMFPYDFQAELAYRRDRLTALARPRSNRRGTWFRNRRRPH